MGKIYSFLKKCDIKFDWKQRIILIFLVIFYILGLSIGSIFSVEKKDTGSQNIYLKEEVCFADEVFISVQSINVFKSYDFETSLDEDGDVLSKYTLNLL